jgi:hypothetical protein
MSAKRERRRSSKTAPTSLEVRERWPIHWLVWEGRDAELEAALRDEECEREQEDPRGRTPLHLAVTLGKVQCADVLLRNGANALAINRHNWTGDPSPFSTHIAFPFHFLLSFSYAHFLCLLHRRWVLSFLFYPILPLSPSFVFF